jgi:hypothetical protein
MVCALKKTTPKGRKRLIRNDERRMLRESISPVDGFSWM